ncbi:hypothetical protein [Kitasatospora aureofaciens]|uniref:hypothetical protein n=1 Tax=Kitasatospora aureofaciens TaxID=1894 RepID=UPI0037C9B3B2
MLEVLPARAQVLEHALADHKRWKGVARWTRHRDTLPAIYLVAVGLVSDRTAAI